MGRVRHDELGRAKLPVVIVSTRVQNDDRVKVGWTEMHGASFPWPPRDTRWWLVNLLLQRLPTSHTTRPRSMRPCSSTRGGGDGTEMPWPPFQVKTSTLDSTLALQENSINIILNRRNVNIAQQSILLNISLLKK